MPENQFAHGAASSLPAQSGYCAPYLYLLEDERPPTGRQKRTYTQRKIQAISKAIQAGYGQGRGDSYQPWIRIRRNFSSPCSYQVFDSVALHTRTHHFLSALEFQTALLISYLGASELRECLPLWPYDHPHPDSGISEKADIQLDPATGLLAIAKRAGIDHGFFVGTTVLYVASLDLMFRVRQGQTWRLVGISCKPKDIVKKSKRAQERIELDRLYCAAIGAHHAHEDGSEINLTLVRQIAWMRPLVSDLRAYRNTTRLVDFITWFDEYASERCISEAVKAAGRRTGLNHANANKFFRLGVWLHMTDIDLTQCVQMRSQIMRGGTQVLNTLKSRYWGAHHG